jgi:ribulose-5-phosphate 4-epimerase/fuculose-1-phosphate aldolase
LRQLLNGNQHAATSIARRSIGSRPGTGSKRVGLIYLREYQRFSRQDQLVAIKPSGVPYETMKPKDLVVTDLHGKIVEGNLKASSDLPRHLVLYKAFPEIGGVTHTHSEYATAWAEAHRPISCLGTTHADYFHGPVPVTADMTDREIASAYEKNTGDAIVEHLNAPTGAVPAVLVSNHGPFTWAPGCKGRRTLCSDSGMDGSNGLFHDRNLSRCEQSRPCTSRQALSS